MTYPLDLAPRGDTKDEYPYSVEGHNYGTVSIPDPYRFLEDPDSEATKNWVKS